uniref:Uncharacterized protein n=1 Tax=viral metagenome TaxID=1070528 RepID=A0A6C0ARV2_9ZZZZ
MNYELVNENYSALLNLPLVQKLIKKNKKLRKENKSLRNLIQSLPEFRCSHKRDSYEEENVPDNTRKTIRLNAVIKTEPMDEIIDRQTIVIDDNDEVEIVTKELTQNIVYTLEDNTVEEEEEEEEVEEEEEEEEEEAKEKEEDEENEEAKEKEKEEAEEAEEEEEEASEAEAEEEEEAEEDEKEEASEEEAEEEVFEIDINGKTYYTTNQQTGLIYTVSEDDDVGDEVGKFEKGTPVFYKKK